MSDDRKIIGNDGENIAQKYLENLNYKLIQKNYRCKLGEIDLIMLDKDVVVFIEVKLRNNNFFGPASLAVNSYKQKKIINVAKLFIQQNKLNKQTLRFDVVGIDNKNNEWVCSHYRNAFMAIS